MTQAADTGAGRSFIIGIAGGTASGKSTLAAALIESLAQGEPSLRAEQVSMDRYFRRNEGGGPWVTLPGSEPRFNANHPDSADNALLVQDVKRRSTEPDAPDVILIEGLMALYVDIIRDILDLRLFVELDADVRALRRMLRGPQRSGRPLTPSGLEGGIAYYNWCARVGHELYVAPSMAHADLIIRGDADLVRTAGMIGDIVRARVAARSR